jgi:hypothetical protein
MVCKEEGWYYVVEEFKLSMKIKIKIYVIFINLFM